MSKKSKQKAIDPADFKHDCPRCSNRVGRLLERIADLEGERDGLRHQVTRLSYGGYAGTSLPTYDDHVEVINRVHLPSLLVAIGQARDGHLGAQDYGPSGATPPPFCERCESTECSCRQSTVPTANPAGPTVYPSIPDRAGDMAVRLALHPDAARKALDRAHRAQRFVAAAARLLEPLHREYSPHVAAAHQRTEVENTPGCKSCARLKITLSDGTEVNRWEPIYRNELCSWCHEYRRKTAKGWPSTHLLRAHHSGSKKVTIPVTKAS